MTLVVKHRTSALWSCNFTRPFKPSFGEISILVPRVLGPNVYLRHLVFNNKEMNLYLNIKLNIKELFKFSKKKENAH